MKILAYACRPDEAPGFEKFTKELPIEVTYVYESLSSSNAHLAQGFEAVTILGNCNASREVVAVFHVLGVKFVASCSEGSKKIDLNVAEDIELRVSL